MAITDLGFWVAGADPGVFIVHIKRHMLVPVVHVNDCTMTGSSPKLIAAYKGKLHKWYALMDLRPVSWLLGIQVTHDHKMQAILLSQEAYIKTIITRFTLADAKPYSTPMVPSASYSKDDSPASANDAAQMRKVLYCKAIGSLMYALVTTQPDIMFTVSALLQFLENLGEAHWQAVKRVFHYLAGMHNVMLTYRGEQEDLHRYTDTDGAFQDHC